jgi:hypothetical protein
VERRLAEKDVHELARCISLDVDCAEVCRTAVALMARESELSAALCETSAQICDACAEECERHPMEHCRQCAQACRRCAQECRRMASSMPARRAQAPMGAPAH